ncbi:unnamed protein product, partial [Rotaria magnacalcarata]
YKIMTKCKRPCVLECIKYDGRIFSLSSSSPSSSSSSSSQSSSSSSSSQRLIL